MHGGGGKFFQNCTASKLPFRENEFKVFGAGKSVSGVGRGSWDVGKFPNFPENFREFSEITRNFNVAL